MTHSSVRSAFWQQRLLNAAPIIMAISVLLYGTPVFGAEVNPDASESNDSAQTATALTLNADSIPNTIHSSADVDWFTFNAVAGGAYLIDLYSAKTTNSYGVEADLYAADDLDDSVGHGSSAVEQGKHGYIHLRADAAQQYYLKVESFSGGSWGHEYTIQVKDRGDEFESNSTFATAKSIALGADAQKHDLHTEKDRDIVKFIATAGATYRIEVKNTGMRGSGTYMRLYAPQGAIDLEAIEADEDATKLESSRDYTINAVHGIGWTTERDATLYVTIEEFGTWNHLDTGYEVRAYREGGTPGRWSNDPGYGSGSATSGDQTAGTGTSGTGTDADTGTPTTGTAADTSGNTAGQATSVGTGSSYSGTLNAANDQDWFSFNAQKGKTYTLQTELLGSRADTTMKLYKNPQGEPIAVDTNSGGKSATGIGYASKIEFTPSEGGRYYILIVPYSAETVGAETDYKLRLSSTESVYDADLAKRLAGRILLQVQQNGEAWYVNPLDLKRYSMGRPSDAFRLMRGFGLGVSESHYRQFHAATKTPERLRGRILLRVEANGEGYYAHPIDRTMHFLGRPSDAFRIMRNLGLGITDANLAKIPLGG